MLYRLDCGYVATFVDVHNRYYSIYTGMVKILSFLLFAADLDRPGTFMHTQVETGRSTPPTVPVYVYEWLLVSWRVFGEVFVV